MVCLNIKEHLFGLHKEYLIKNMQVKYFCTETAQHGTAHK